MKLEKIKLRINSIRTAYPMYDELLTFFEKIVTKQDEFKQQIQIESSFPDIEESKVKKKIEAGIPLLEDEEFELDFPSTSQLFDALCEITKAQNDKLRNEVQKIERTVKESNVDLRLKSLVSREELFRKVAHNELDYIDKISDEFSLNESVLTLLTLNSVKPSIELIAHQLQDSVDIESWSGISCPICGSPPVISELRGEEGRRILFCSFCSTDWQGRRIMCYHCGNTDHQTLRYFYTQEEEKYRIDVCDKCKHYLKTLDSRKFDGEIVPSVEDIATLHLDILAEGENYQNVALTSAAHF
ncbi:TPA: formate dehydrogenase accessory protein FdhE [Candidatus Poribacteria bacterium]|nr:formate dehydrogenase accessory protein FdhE [Candidatus Poribacteria bacterium]